jgi:Fur family transcriptional regulator, zinc uptake regulator
MTPAGTEADAHDHSAEAASLTRNQRLVLDALERAGTPRGAYALLGELRTEGFKAPLQVYRALDKLLEAGLVHRLESLNAFVACARPHCHVSRAAAFAICGKCGTVAEFADDVLDRRLADWTRERGFVATKTTVEINGVCAACAA